MGYQVITRECSRPGCLEPAEAPPVRALLLAGGECWSESLWLCRNCVRAALQEALDGMSGRQRAALARWCAGEDELAAVRRG